MQLSSLPRLKNQFLQTSYNIDKNNPGAKTFSNAQFPCCTTPRPGVWGCILGMVGEHG